VKGSQRGEFDVPTVAVRKGGGYVGGWWNYGGILREVYLRKVDRLDFTTVFARPELPCATCAATVQINAFVANLGDRRAKPVVEGRIGSRAVSFTQGSIRGHRYVTSATRLVRQLDPTRLVGLSLQGYPTVGKQTLYTKVDALGVNDYFGWYPGPRGSVANRASLGPYLDRLHSDYPRQALFVTEFGAEANRDGPAAEKGTYAFQQDFLSYHLGVFAPRPLVSGAILSILKDFYVKPGYDGGDPKPDPPVSHMGLVDPRGPPPNLPSQPSNGFCCRNAVAVSV
jgi:hypothetical protein